MSSEVEIINLALSNIRAGSINSLTENSLPAQIAKLKYPIMRDFLLTELPWQFARRIVALAPVTTEIFNWAFAYQYPVDCLKISRLIGSFEELPAASSDVVSRIRDSEVRSLRNIRQQIPYEVFNFTGTKIIGADQDELRMDFVVKVTDPNLFSNAFTLAFSHLLSAEMAIPLVGAETGRQLRSDSLQIYRQYLAAAMANDLNDGYHEPKESEFVNVRS